MTAGAADGRIDPRKALLLTVVGLGALVAGVAIAGHVYRAPLVALSKTFVAWTGWWGPAVIFLVADAVTVPVPPDIFMALAMVGDIPIWQIGVSCSCASICGGTIGFFIGQKLRGWGPVARRLEGRGAEAQLLVKRYGAAAVAFAALTPFPYFIACWAAGALRMPLPRFWAVSLLRIPRVFGYLWLMRLGVLDVL